MAAARALLATIASYEGRSTAATADVMLVRARGEQRADDLDVAEEARPDQRRPTVTGHCINFGATAKELAHNIEVASIACVNKRREVVVVSRLNVRAPVAQFTYARQVATARRPAKTRSLASAVLEVDDGLPQRVVAAHTVGVGSTQPGRDAAPRLAVQPRTARRFARVAVQRDKADDVGQF